MTTETTAAVPVGAADEASPVDSNDQFALSETDRSRATRPSRQHRPGLSPTGWSSIPRQSTAVG